MYFIEHCQKVTLYIGIIEAEPEERWKRARHDRVEQDLLANSISLCKDREGRKTLVCLKNRRHLGLSISVLSKYNNTYAISKYEIGQRV